MIRKQQPYGLLKTAGHLVSMPCNVNSVELSQGHAFEFPPTHQTYFGRFANTAKAYSITDGVREQYTVTGSDVGTLHFFRVLSV